MNSYCNVYPKIFGGDTSDVNFLDIDIHEDTDVIVSGGLIKDDKILPSNNYYPLLLVHSLTTTAVKWVLTDYSRVDT